MALRDHALFFVVGACAVTAGAAWTLSEKLRVAPISAQLEKQIAARHSSPVISSVTVTKERNGSQKLVQQHFSFRDPEGDAKFLNYVVIRTNAQTLSVTSYSLTASKEQQMAGTTVKATWTCGEGAYFVTLRAIMTDSAGNLSAPTDYTVDCDG